MNIFTFGSNLSGIHGLGAARHAHLKHGAIWGVAEGPTGRSYAIPTKDASIRHTLPLEEISRYVNRFIAYARVSPDLTFQVTCIGCGLAGLKHVQVAPLFKDAPKNCHFDYNWMEILGNDRTYWGSFP
jgi:hypothetical protein